MYPFCIRFPAVNSPLTVNQHNNHHILQNPVEIWANIYDRVMALAGSSPSTHINHFFNKSIKRVEVITSDKILASIRWAVEELGFELLGYHHHEVGCHPIRSGATMAMYLKRVPTFTIML